MTIKPEANKGRGEAIPLPISTDEQAPGNGTLPLAAAGAVLLAGGYLGTKALKRKAVPGSGQTEEVPFPAERKWEKPMMSGFVQTSSCTTGTKPIDIGCAFGSSDVPPPKPCKTGGGETSYCGTGGTHNYEVKCVSGDHGRQAG